MVSVLGFLPKFLLNSVKDKSSNLSSLEKEMPCNNTTESICKLKEIDNAPVQTRTGLQIRVLKLQELESVDRNIKRFQFGQSNNQVNTGRLILVGKTGSGKTTLVNSIVNNLLGVKFEDDFRYSVFDLNTKYRSLSESQTDFVTEYTFNYIDGMKRKCNFVFVDTPGLDDTKGEEVQKENMKQILKYISKESSKVGLVIPSSVNRLTAEQKSILMDMKTLINSGKIESLYILATFTDSDPPNVKYVLDGDNISYSSIHLFNNNALYSRNQGIRDNDLTSFKLNWDASNRSLDELLDLLRY